MQYNLLQLGFSIMNYNTLLWFHNLFVSNYFTCLNEENSNEAVSTTLEDTMECCLTKVLLKLTLLITSNIQITWGRIVFLSITADVYSDFVNGVFYF